MKLLGLVLLVVAAACSSEKVTTVRLKLRYDETWGLTRFDIAVRDRREQIGVYRELRLLLPDDWAGTPLKIDLWALRGEERWAHGATEVTPAR